MRQTSILVVCAILLGVSALVGFGVIIWAIATQSCGDPSGKLGLNIEVIYDGRTYYTWEYSLSPEGTLVVEDWYSCGNCKCEHQDTRVIMPAGTYIIEERK